MKWNQPAMLALAASLAVAAVPAESQEKSAKASEDKAASADKAQEARSATGSPILEPGAGIPMGAMTLPENPGFKTKHLVTIIYGNGVRKMEMGNPEIAPNLSRIAKQSTLFTEDYAETANLRGYMYTEVLTGRDAPSQQPRYPTFTEYVRKKSGLAEDLRAAPRRRQSEGVCPFHRGIRRLTT